MFKLINNKKHPQKTFSEVFQECFCSFSEAFQESFFTVSMFFFDKKFPRFFLYIWNIFYQVIYIAIKIFTYSVKMFNIKTFRHFIIDIAYC